MTTHDDFRTDEELKELGYERVDNRVKKITLNHTLTQNRSGHLRPGHYVVELDTPEQRVMRWVWDDEGRSPDTEPGV